MINLIQKAALADWKKVWMMIKIAAGLMWEGVRKEHEQLNVAWKS